MTSGFETTSTILTSCQTQFDSNLLFVVRGLSLCICAWRSQNYTQVHARCEASWCKDRQTDGFGCCGARFQPLPLGSSPYHINTKYAIGGVQLLDQ